MAARLVAAVLVLVLGAPWPAAARSKHCAGGRFLVEQGPLLMGEPATIPADAYCAKALGDCRGEGVCRQQPGACIGVLEPACGCDGRTYINACEAARGATGLRSPGHCSRGCGTIAGIACPEGSFCDQPPG